MQKVVEALNSSKMSAADIAEKYGHEKVVEILRNEIVSKKSEDEASGPKLFN